MIAAIVLAAGESRRMGRQKVLLPYGSTTILGHILDQIGSTSIGEVLVVTGHHPEPVRAALLGSHVRLIHNSDYAAGMLSSVRAGLRGVPNAATGVMLFLGDHPEVTSTLITTLLDGFEPGRGDILLPIFGGRRGHPLLFDASYRDEILHGFDDTGLRGLFRAHPDRLVEVPWHEDGILHDLDTPADYEAARQRQRVVEEP